MNKENNSMCFGMRLITRFIVFFYLFQISFVSYATVLSSAEIEYQLDSNLLFEYVPSSREYVYEESEAVRSQAPNAIDLNVFYETIFDSYNELLPPPVLIPISAGDITTIIPTYPRDKLVGPALVQSRLVRTQIKELLGRNLINQSAPGGAYVNEVAQLNTLYSNTLNLLGNSSAVLSNIPGLEFGLPLNRSTQDSGLEKDIIWPELRTIRGQEVVVPIVYLTKATYDQNRVNGHTIQFAGNASFDNLTIDNSTVRFERDAFLNVAGNLTNTEGVIVGNGDLDIVAGGVLHNISSLITAVDGDLSILADRIESRTLIHRYDFNGGHSERFGDVSEVSASGDVTLRSYNDILISGTDVISENESIRFAADGNIYIVAQAANSESTRPKGRWRVNQTSSIDYLSSTLNAEDAIELIANGNILIDASEIVAGNGHLEILAGLGITVQEELEKTQFYRRGRFGKTKIKTSLYKTVAIRSLLDAGRGVTLHAGFGDITLRAAEITSQEGTNVQALNGDLNLLVTRENDHYNYNSVRKGLFTVRTINRGHDIETVVSNSIVGGFNVEALNSLVVEFEGDPEADFNGQLDMLQTLPGLEWISVARNVENVDWVAIEGKYEEWNEKSTSLSPAALAVVSIVAAIAIGPGVASFYGASGATAVSSATVATVAGSPVLGAAAVAATTSLITAASIAQLNALVDGRDPLEATYQTITSEATLRSAAVSAVTAGAIAAVDAEFFNETSIEGPDFRLTSRDIPLPNGEIVSLPTLSLAGQALQGLSHAAVSAGIQHVAFGSDFQEVFEQSIFDYAASNIGEYAATEIGLAFDIQNPTGLQTALKYISHAGVGCLIGAASAAQSDEELSEACFSQAGGAVIGEFIGSAIAETGGLEATEEDLYTFLENQTQEAMNLQAAGHSDLYIEDYFRKRTGYFQSELNRFRKHGADLAKISAGLAAFIGGANSFQVNAAANGAYNAAYYNAGSTLIAVASIHEALEKLRQQLDETEGPTEFLLNALIDEVVELGVENGDFLTETLSSTLSLIGIDNTDAFFNNLGVVDATPEISAGLVVALLDTLGIAAVAADVSLRTKFAAIVGGEAGEQLLSTNVDVVREYVAESVDAVLHLPDTVENFGELVELATTNNDSEAQIQVSRALFGVVIGAGLQSAGAAAAPATFGASGTLIVAGGIQLVRPLRVLKNLSDSGRVNIAPVLDALPFETRFIVDRTGETQIEFRPRVESSDLSDFRINNDGTVEDLDLTSAYRDNPGHILVGPRGGVYQHIGRDKNGNLVYRSDNNMFFSEVNGSLVRMVDSFRTGFTGEGLVSEKLFREGDWVRVNGEVDPARFIDDDLPDYRGSRGLDGVYTRLDVQTGMFEYIVVETKSSLQGLATDRSLSETADGTQLSRDYVRNRIDDPSMGGLSPDEFELFERARINNMVTFVRANVTFVMPGFNIETSTGDVSFRIINQVGDREIAEGGIFDHE